MIFENQSILVMDPQRLLRFFQSGPKLLGWEDDQKNALRVSLENTIQETLPLEITKNFDMAV